jgi:hypothetical protein
LTVHLYTVCWDEADMLGFFFRHYDSWVDRYVVYDDGSTDGSLEVLRAHPKVEVRRFERVVPGSFVQSHTAMQDQVWKESRGQADWVVITAIDEHLLAPGRPDMRAWLAELKAAEVALIPAIGFDMICETFPDPAEGHLAELVRAGRPTAKFNKLSLFDPNLVAETRYTPGRHRADPLGRLNYPDKDELVLLHFNRIGFERVYRRRSEQSARRHFGLSREAFRAAWDAELAQAVDLTNPAPARDQAARATFPWWRRRSLKVPLPVESDRAAWTAIKMAAKRLYDDLNGPGSWKAANPADRARVTEQVQRVLRSLHGQGWRLTRADEADEAPGTPGRLPD